MKKVFSLMLVFVLVCALGLTAAGCKSAGKTTSENNAYGDQIPGGTADISKEAMAALADSGTISYYEFGGDSDEQVEWRKGFDDYYKNVYNGTVDRIYTEWENWEDKFITDYAADDAPDLIYLFEKNWPKLANRGMVFSVNQLKNDEGVLALDHPKLTADLDLVEDIYTYKGESYTFATNMAEADMIFVNEDLFKQYSVKSPSAYYEEGMWNWETFEQCASELTRDTDGDGVSDVYGYQGWDANFIVTAAGGQLIDLADDGKLTVTMSQPAALQGLENVHNIYGNLKCATGEGSFSSGKLGMIAWMPRNEYKYLTGEGADKYTFNWSMVPYPLDTRTNKDGIRSGKSYAWCVSTTSDNAQGCINYIIATRTYEEEFAAAPGAMDYTKCFTEEQLQMIEDCSRNAVVPIYQGVGSLWHDQWDFWTALKRSGTTVNELVQTYENMFQAQVTLENDNATN